MQPRNLDPVAAAVEDELDGLLLEPLLEPAFGAEVLEPHAASSATALTAAAVLRVAFTDTS
jgi:hypothetical protein